MTAADIEASKARCREEWDNVNDPPCHPSDEDWRPCPLCSVSTPKFSQEAKRRALSLITPPADEPAKGEG